MKDSDYDHEITLVDNGPSPAALRPTSAADSEAGPAAAAAVPVSSHEQLVPPKSSSSAKRPHSKDGKKKKSGAPEVNTGEGTERGAGASSKDLPSVAVDEPTPLESENPLEEQQNGSTHQRPRRKTPETFIDILYENQRGLFLCGVGLFSSKALGNLDPPAWTNIAHHASPTDITTAQVPDPSWEWAWPEWRVNHDEGDDEGGWEYSFMFARKFSWHGPKWYSSFVRRRAWIRKRVKKGDIHNGQQDPRLLNLEYFTVQPAAVTAAQRRSASRASRLSSTHRPGSSKASFSQVSDAVLSDAGDEVDESIRGDIDNMDMLLRILRLARIDREKVEAVDSFLEHAGEEIARLPNEMHDIMSMFVFQASRKVLLKRLTQLHEEAMAAAQKEEKNRKKKGKASPAASSSNVSAAATGDGNSESVALVSDAAQMQVRVTALQEAIKHADEELRRMEYWSDIKAMAEEGESGGAVDAEKGWDDEKWAGVDKSGPAAPDVPDDRDEDEKPKSKSK